MFRLLGAQYLTRKLTSAESIFIAIHYPIAQVSVQKRPFFGTRLALRRFRVRNPVNQKKKAETCNLYRRTHIFRKFVHFVFRGSVADVVCTPNISGFDTAGTHLFACTLGVPYCLHSQPVLSVFGPSRYPQCSGLLSTRSVLFASIPTLSVLGPRNVLGTPSTGSICLYEPLAYLERQETFTSREYILQFVLYYSPGHTILCRHPHLTQPLCSYVYAASVKLIAASHLFSFNTHLTAPP